MLDPSLASIGVVIGQNESPALALAQVHRACAGLANHAVQRHQTNTGLETVLRADVKKGIAHGGTVQQRGGAIEDGVDVSGARATDDERTIRSVHDHGQVVECQIAEGAAAKSPGTKAAVAEANVEVARGVLSIRLAKVSLGCIQNRAKFAPTEENGVVCGIERAVLSGNEETARAKQRAVGHRGAEGCGERAGVVLSLRDVNDATNIHATSLVLRTDNERCSGIEHIGERQGDGAAAGAKAECLDAAGLVAPRGAECRAGVGAIAGVRTEPRLHIRCHSLEAGKNIGGELMVAADLHGHPIAPVIAGLLVAN